MASRQSLVARHHVLTPISIMRANKLVDVVDHGFKCRPALEAVSSMTSASSAKSLFIVGFLIRLHYCAEQLQFFYSA